MIDLTLILDGEEHGSYQRGFVPRIGDEIKLSDGTYAQVLRVVWDGTNEPIDRCELHVKRREKIDYYSKKEKELA